MIVPNLEFYIDEKQRKKSGRILKIKIYGGIIVFILLLAGVFYAVVYSPLFHITRTKVDCTLTNAEEAQIYPNKEKLISDLKIFFVSQSKITGFLGENNILIWNNNVGDFLKQNPQIINLSIEKNYFNREVKINFQKREQFGVWCEKKQLTINNQQLTTNDKQRSIVNGQLSIVNNCWWFDKNGVAFERAPKTEGEMIYKVDDFSERQLTIGDKVIKEDLFANLLRIFNILEQSDLNVRTLQIKDLSLQETIIEPVNVLMPKIYFSLRFDPVFTMPAIQAIKEYGLSKIEYVDFRVENRAYYKIK